MYSVLLKTLEYASDKENTTAIFYNCSKTYHGGKEIYSTTKYIYCQTFVLYTKILCPKLDHRSVKIRKVGKNWAGDNNLFQIYINYK